jgi:adenylate kinase
MNVILLGAPGSGKGTQASRIAEKYSILHISTGDIFRENIKNKTPLGVTAKAFIDEGHLVPDELTVSMVKERLSRDDCKNGVLLDGFPRTISQAIALDDFLKVDYAIDIDVPYGKIVDRIVNRRSCLTCGGTFNVKTLENPNVCPTCGKELYQRKDDNVETANERISVYDTQTKPLLEYYSQKGLLKKIDGDRDIETVFADVVKVLG